MAALGVDYVRVSLLWRVVAEGARDTKALDKRFRRLGADNPKAYPKANWDRFDRLARACKTLGIGLYLDVTGPGPKWGHPKAPKKYRKDQRWWKPKPREFYKFVQAVGKRFSGTFKDENDGHQLIPRVSFWTLWNEPNQGGWLRPQWLNGKPYSPKMYRQLYIFGHKALVRTGHGNDLILIGETAPSGVARQTTTSAMAPGLFIRSMLCAPGAVALSCNDFQKYGPILTSGWAHHPYTKRNAPATREADPNALTMANIGDLPTLLDGIAQQTGHIAANLPIFSTEFGYETNPPDPFNGIALDTQALYINAGDLLAYVNPRIAANTQFLLADVSPAHHHQKNSRSFWGTYQSGLYFRRGQAKPSATAYRFPFLAFTTGVRDPESNFAQVSLWGQLRFRPNNLPPDAYDKVQLQFAPADGSADWTNLGDPLTVSNGKGFFEATVLVPAAGYLRAHWSGAQLPFEAVSRAMAVGG
jgi:hypothetical protein